MVYDVVGGIELKHTYETPFISLIDTLLIQYHVHTYIRRYR